MNKPTKTSDIPEWIDAPAKVAAPVAGYEAWLEKDLANGLADLRAGNVTPLATIRKEFGLE